MHVRPTYRPPQTIKQAKAEYKKYGPRISSQELRRLQRGEELLQRADKIKDAERRRKQTQKRKQEKEAKEREARRRMGISAPKPTVSGSQFVLDGFMTGVKKLSHLREEATIQEAKLSPISEEEPWEDELDDGTLMDVEIPRNQPQTPCGKEHNRSTSTEASPAITTPTISDIDGAWDELLISNTQIELEIKMDRSEHKTPAPTIDQLLSLISTQDVTLSLDDLDELGMRDAAFKREPCAPTPSITSKERDKILMPPPAQRPKIMKPQNHCTGASDFWCSDFDLSSQDFREICGQGWGI